MWDNILPSFHRIFRAAALNQELKVVNRRTSKSAGIFIKILTGVEVGEFVFANPPFQNIGWKAYRSRSPPGGSVQSKPRAQRQL